MHTFELTTGEISKIEGKCSLSVKVVDDKVTDVKFAITEFKRFYTQALRGKDVMGLPQLSCRICGTCSNAHLLCAIKAAENALGIVPSEQTKILRKLLNYGLIIRDHALHLYVFSLPDLFGIDNVLELDENIPEQHQILDDTFSVKAAGNNLSKVIGGRSVHAPYPAVGGFMKLPNQADFPKLIDELENIRPAVLRLIQLFVSCEYKLDRDITYVAQTDGDYCFLEGDIQQSTGETVKEADFGQYLEHTVIPYSHASGYKWKGAVHMLGALSRVNLGKENLHPRTKEDAKVALSRFPSKNLYDNNIAQAIEILHAIDSSIDILKELTIKDEKIPPVQRKTGVGVGVIEAPRGTLYYKIALDEKGVITNVDIVVPTGQNQIGIEGSLRDYISVNVDQNKDTLIHESEKIVRAYDPCMSCASHFLKVKWKITYS
jgi:sulfhydrogenase subunit alpha